MSRLRIFAFIALISFALGISFVGDALAGEKIKFRDTNYSVKAEFVPVGDEEGHIVVVFEGKGICTNLQGKKFLDGWLIRNVGLNDAKPNSETWSFQGYAELTDPESDKIYVAWEGKKVKKDLPGEGTVRLVKGTGKWQGIQGRGKWTSYNPANDRWYSDVEWDVELPR
jgi:hypothetical protein